MLTPMNCCSGLSATKNRNVPAAGAFFCQLANKRRNAMRAALKGGLIVAMLLAAPVVAQAGTVEGAAIGAGTGAVIAGPPGAVVGGVIGATVGGPNIVTRRHYYARASRVCWRDRLGHRHCRWR
jgi:osmotically inducible lipoprotein OsmB